MSKSQQPIFFDSLARPDGYWFTHSPTKKEPWRIAYARGALELSGTVKGDYVAELGPSPTDTTGDMVVEVTAIQSGTVTNTSGDGVGLILRALPDLSDFLAFTIQHNGDWQLQHFHYVDDNPADNWTTIDDSYQPVTSTPTGPNHLMAVLHGSTIILYVNGHQVATEPNTFTSVSWLSSGLAGVYLDDTRLVGDFTDYAVYALPPQDLHSAVMRAVPWLGWLW